MLFNSKNRYITIASFINGNWEEKTYRTDDPDWKEVFSIIKDSKHPVKLYYH